MPKDREVPPNPFEHWEHVNYEVQRLAKDQLVAIRAFAKSREPHLPEHERSDEQDTANRALEAALLHLRNVADFLECRDERPGDMHAKDFLVGATTAWKPPASGEVLPKPIRDRLNWEINHLTYKRSRDDQSDRKLWQPEAAERALRFAQKFFEAVGRPFPLEALTFFEVYAASSTVNAAAFVGGMIPHHTAPSLAAHTSSSFASIGLATLAGPLGSAASPSTASEAERLKRLGK